MHAAGHPDGDVSLGKTVADGSDVLLEYQHRDLGSAILGKSGTGKSSIMERLILSDLEQGRPALVIDPHGLLTDRIISGAPSADARDRIILLEASLTGPFGLNLLATREPVDDDDDPVMWAADSVVDTFKKLYGETDEFLPRLERYLHLAARTLIPARGTVADIPSLLEDAEFRSACISKVHSQSQRRGLQRSWSSYEQLRPSDRATHIDPVVNRLEPVLSASLMQGILGNPQTTVSFDAILKGDAIMLVSPPFGENEQAACRFYRVTAAVCISGSAVYPESGTKPPPTASLSG